jgi:hypothetical protein
LVVYYTLILKNLYGLEIFNRRIFFSHTHSLKVRAHIHYPREDFCKATLIYSKLPGPAIVPPLHLRTNGGGMALFLRMCLSPSYFFEQSNFFIAGIMVLSTPPTSPPFFFEGNKMPAVNLRCSSAKMQTDITTSESCWLCKISLLLCPPVF